MMVKLRIMHTEMPHIAVKHTLIMLRIFPSRAFEEHLLNHKKSQTHSRRADNTQKGAIAS